MSRSGRFGGYTLLKSLGAGGSGEVWLARPAEGSGLPSPIVVKILHDGLGEQPSFVRRFKHEARVAARVEHPHLPRLFDAGVVDGALYLTSEYVPGWTLRRILDDVEGASDRVSVRSAVDLIRGVCRGLHALHEAEDPDSGQPLEFVHRDITPDNILLGEDGRARVIDLGLGTSSLQDWRTTTGVVMGSPGYMAPEQVLAQPVDRRTDVYALGIVLWEMLTQRRYVERGPMPVVLRRQVQPTFRPPSEFRGDVPPELDATLARALALGPADRFPSAAALEEALAGPSAQERESEGELLSTLVGEMLWGELGDDRTEVTQLLTLAGPAADAHALPATAAPTVAPVPNPQATPAVLTPSLPLVVPVQPGLPPWKVAFLMLATLMAGICLGALVLSIRRSPVHPAPVRRAEPQAEPSAAPAPPTIVAPSPAVRPSVEPTGTEALGPTTKRVSSSRPPAAETPPRTAPLKASPKPLERLRDLLTRARRLARDTTSTKQRRQAEALVFSISREMAAPKPAVIEKLEAELEQVERGE